MEVIVFRATIFLYTFKKAPFSNIIKNVFYCCIYFLAQLKVNMINWSLRDDNRMVVASRRRGDHGRDGRRFAATKRLRSSLRDDNIDDEVVMSWRSPLRGDETVAVVASRRDDGMMTVASRRRGGHGGDGRRFAATRWSQLYFRRLTPIFLP